MKHLAIMGFGTRVLLDTGLGLPDDSGLLPLSKFMVPLQEGERDEDVNSHLVLAERRWCYYWDTWERTSSNKDAGLSDKAWDYFVVLGDLINASKDEED